MFRFTIRGVLWLMVVVGLGVALWIEHSALLQERKNSTLWSRRGDAALRVMNKLDVPANWHEDGMVVQEIHPSGAPITRLYKGSDK
jgi:hypothetical protein